MLLLSIPNSTLNKSVYDAVIFF